MMLKNRRHDIKPNDTKHNDTQQKGLVCDIQHNDALHNAECRYAECCIFYIIMVSVIMLNVIILSVVAPNRRLMALTRTSADSGECDNPKSCLDRVFKSKLGRFTRLCSKFI